MTEPSHKAVVTENAPSPYPHLFPQGVITANGMVFCSGSIAMDPKMNKVIDGDIQAHTHQVIRNMKGVSEAAGSRLERIVKINIFLTDMNDFGKMNEVYGQYFTTNTPCRTCVAVKTLPFNTDIEMECTAML